MSGVSEAKNQAENSYWCGQQQMVQNSEEDIENPQGSKAESGWESGHDCRLETKMM